MVMSTTPSAFTARNLVELVAAAGPAARSGRVFRCSALGLLGHQVRDLPRRRLGQRDEGFAFDSRHLPNRSNVPRRVIPAPGPDFVTPDTRTVERNPRRLVPWYVSARRGPERLALRCWI